MKRTLKSIIHSIAQLIASESGELLSTRRKAHLLQNQMYSRLARKHRPANSR